MELVVTERETVRYRVDVVRITRERATEARRDADRYRSWTIETAKRLLRGAPQRTSWLAALLSPLPA